MQPSQLFSSRIAGLRTAFALTEENALAILVGSSENGMPENQKNVAVNLHLFDEARPVESSLLVIRTNSVTIFTEKACSDLKDRITANLTENVEFCHWKPEDTVSTLRDKLAPIKEFFIIKKELDLQEGPLADAFREFLKLHHPSSTQEAAQKCTQSLNIKDAAAIESVQKAAAFASTIMKSYVLPNLEEAMLQDEDEPPYLASAFATDIERTITDPTSIRGLEDIKTQVYGIALAPVRLHIGGGKMNMLSEESVLPQNKPLRPEAIALSYAVRYRGYAAYIGRTILYNCDDATKDAYASLVALMGHFTGALVPGAVVSECWLKAKEWYAEHHPGLAPHLGVNGGFGVGLEMLSSISWLSPKNQRPLQAGMTFAVRLTLEDVRPGRPEAFSLLLADTFLVGAASADAPSVLTGGAPFELEDVSRKVSTHEAMQTDEPEAGHMHTRSSGRTNKGANLQLEQTRKAMQDEIIARKKETAGSSQRQQAPSEADHAEMARLARGEINLNLPQGATSAELSAFYKRHLASHTSSVHAYYDIVLDTDREILLLPNLCGAGSLTVVHLCTVKNAEVKSEQPDRSLGPKSPSLVFRLFFHSAVEANAAYRTHPRATFFKELAYRVTFEIDPNAPANHSHVIVQNMQNLVSLIKRTQAVIAAREKQREAVADIQEQTGLIFARGLDSSRVLRDVRCYPNPRTTAAGRGAAAKQTFGTVEVHENGVRFVQKESDPLVVLFSNIATVVFQPADNDQRIVFHLHLRQNVLVGKKKTRDVQFYLDVMEEYDGIATRRGGASWEDEVEEEERERQRTARLNSEFLHFAKGFEKAHGGAVCVPIRKFHFYGTHDKGMAKFKGSERVLFSLTDTPPFVESMEGVEIAVFERVTAMKTNFDLTFVRADYTFRAVNNIEYKFLDKIKDWLNDAGTKYYEVGVNLVWRTVLKEIRADDSWDPWGAGGWHSILAESDEEAASSDDAGSDSSFVMSATDSESDDDGDSSYASSASSSESEASDSSDAVESEEGLDWDELEERAAREDRKRGGTSDDEGKRKRRR